jgi:hypothetical protein
MPPDTVYAVCLLPPDMVGVDLCASTYLGKGTSNNNRVRMTMMVGKELHTAQHGLQTMGRGRVWYEYSLHSLSYIFSTGKARVSVCEKSAYRSGQEWTSRPSECEQQIHCSL